MGIPLKQNEIFAVIVTHNTGHGEASLVIELTRDIKKALEGARNAEKLGYEFYSNETGVGIVRLETERAPYRKEEFKWLMGDRPPQMEVFYRRHVDNGDAGGSWAEEWFDTELQKLAEEVPVTA